MAIDFNNFVLSEVILRNRNLDSATVNRSSLAAGLIPGFAGLILPLLAARNANQTRTGSVPGGNVPGMSSTDLTIVPDCEEDAVADADEKLKASGLKSAHTEVFDIEVLAGEVVSQDPPSNSAVPVGSTVTLFVSKGAVQLEQVAAGPLIDAEQVARAEAAIRSIEENTEKALKASEARTQRELKASEARTQRELKASEERILEALRSQPRSPAE